MAPALPLLCALAGLGLDALVPAARRWVVPVSAGLLVASWGARPLGGDHGHLDGSLFYRPLLLAQVRAVAAARPARVIAHFPRVNALASGPADHDLEAPIPVLIPTGKEPLAELCRADLLVDGAPAMSVEPALGPLRPAGALEPFRDFASGHPGMGVRVYRIRCTPGARAGDAR